MMVHPRTQALRIVDLEDDTILSLEPLQGLWTEDLYLVMTDHARRLIEYTDGYVKLLSMPTPENMRQRKKIRHTPLNAHCLTNDCNWLRSTRSFLVDYQKCALQSVVRRRALVAPPSAPLLHPSRAVLQRLGQVRRANRWVSRKIGNGARELENAVVAACGKL